MKGDDVLFPKFVGKLFPLGDLGGGHEFGDRFFGFFAVFITLRGAASRISVAEAFSMPSVPPVIQ